ITVLYCNPIQCYSFSRLLTHMKHASFSQNSKHKSLNHSHKMQQPFIHPAKGNFAFKTVLCHLKRVLCFLMTNTAHYMSRHSKHRLNTDVLNGKHYYEMGKHQ